METKLKSIAKMDIYGTMRVPFDIATWFRGHKFSSEAVAATRHLRRLDEIETQIAALQNEATAVERRLAVTLCDAKKKMEACNGV